MMVTIGRGDVKAAVNVQGSPQVFGEGILMDSMPT